MAEKTLKEKVKRLMCIFLLCTLIYIILSLFLLNDYSSAATFDAKKVYDVVKDALTLSAAFLAPVAAFVLFSDWRIQFNAQIKHRATTAMFDLQFKLLRQLEYAINGKSSENDGENNSDAEIYFLIRKEFENNIEEIKRACGESEFTIKSTHVLNEFKSLWDEASGLMELKDGLDDHRRSSMPDTILDLENYINSKKMEFDKKFELLKINLEAMDSWKF